MAFTFEGLRRRRRHVLRAWSLRPLADGELDAIALVQGLEAFAIYCRAMKEILAAALILDEPEAFIRSNRPNLSLHSSSFVRAAASHSAVGGRRQQAGVRGTPDTVPITSSSGCSRLNRLPVRTTSASTWTECRASRRSQASPAAADGERSFRRAGARARSAGQGSAPAPRRLAR